MPGQTEGTVKQKTAARKERELKLAFNDLLYQDALLHVSDSDSSMDYGTDSEFGTESDYSDSNDDDDDGGDGDDTLLQLLLKEEKLLRDWLVHHENHVKMKRLNKRISQSTRRRRSFHEYFDNLPDGTPRFTKRQMRNLFRFETIEEIDEIIGVLDLPEYFHTRHRCKFTGKEAFLLLLTTLARERRTLEDLVNDGFTFGSHSAGSEIINYINRWVYYKWAQPLLSMELKAWVGSVERFRRAIRARIDTIRNWRPEHFLPDLGRDTCFHIDGTVYKILRPTHDTESFYNGRYKQQQIVYLAIIAPNGLCVRFGGCFTGRTHDSNAYGQEDIAWEMERLNAKYKELYGDEDSRFVIYGDSAYRKSATLEKPLYSRAGLTDAEYRHNHMMSKLRVDVERYFGLAKNQFKYAASGCIKIEQSPYRNGDDTKVFDMRVWNSFLMQNFMTCMRHNGISQSNDCAPPDLKTYVGMRNDYYHENE